MLYAFGTIITTAQLKSLYVPSTASLAQLADRLLLRLICQFRNSFPDYIRSSDCRVDSFKHLLKTYWDIQHIREYCYDAL